MKKNKLEHAASDKSFAKISSAKSFVPDWYKKQTKFSHGNSDPNMLPAELTFKMCSAFGDAFISGYMIPLPVDIAVKQSENGPIISWSSIAENSGFLQIRDSKLSEHLPIPYGYSEKHFLWSTKHYVKLPKGYSAIFTHPFNRYDLPFMTLTGIIDGEYVVPKGNVPVFFKDNFEGIIPAGTPIIQVIPFKTENWIAIENEKIIKDGDLNDKKSTNLAYGWYKKNIWKKKIYE